MSLDRVGREVIEDRICGAIIREMEAMDYASWGGCGVNDTRTETFRVGEGDTATRLRVEVKLTEIGEDRLPLAEEKGS